MSTTHNENLNPLLNLLINCLVYEHQQDQQRKYGL